MLDATPVFRSPATHKIYKCKQERKWNVYNVSFQTENLMGICDIDVLNVILT